MFIGAHVSIAGGLDTALDRGRQLGINTLQSFASSPRTLKAIYPSREVISLYLKKKTQFNITNHVFHGIYLINLAHEDRSYRRLCVDSLCLYQQLAGEIGSIGTVFHLGSHKGKGLSIVKPWIVESLIEILAKTPPNVFLMLENAAGHGGTIGVSLEELFSIYSAVSTAGGAIEKLAFGIDTQHAFASGIALHTQTGLTKFLSQFNQLFGLEKLKLIHLNDSAYPFASHRDRHANLGEGYIGFEGIKLIVNHPNLKTIPIILEVPGINKDGPGIKDINILKTLISNEDAY